VSEGSVLFTFDTSLAPFPQRYITYNKSLIDEINREYSIAVSARARGLDPSLSVEPEIAFDLADRVEHLLHVPVATRLRELLAANRTEKAALIMAQEYAMGKFGFVDKEIALDQAVRIGLAIVTDGVTVAPIQGISSVKIKANDDNTEYAAIYFAGPMRSAGGTEAAFTVVIADYVRRVLGLEKYRPNCFGEDETGRFVEELRIYERDVGSFQFKVTDEDVQHTLLHLPVEVDGVDTDPVEVVVHRNLSRISTDRVRGGALRVVNDGIIGRARKLQKLCQDLEVTEWDWLSEIRGGKQQGTDETRPVTAASHFDEVISGRPVLGFPGKNGGFRLRYGRSYNTGISAVGLHPAVASLLDNCIVSGTQIKVDLPGKAATISFVDSISGPIVRLIDGSVVSVDSVEEAEALRDRVEKILFLGDILISYGDFLENNYKLPPSGYVEEWWALQFTKELSRKYEDIEHAVNDIGISKERLESFSQNYLTVFPNVLEAFALSKVLGIGLHPRYVYFWDIASPADILLLRQSLRIAAPTSLLASGTVITSAAGIDDCILRGTNVKQLKAVLEKIGIPHKVVDGQDIVISGEVAYSLIRTLGLTTEIRIIEDWKDTCDLLSKLSDTKIYPKSSAFVGVRVGRPEKAMPRKMHPPIHGLFPVGLKGGVSRDILKASEDEKVIVSIVNLRCPHCSSSALSSRCPNCGSETTTYFVCRNCKLEFEDKKTATTTTTNVCPACKSEGNPFSSVPLPIKQIIQRAYEKVGYYPKDGPVKGVKGLTSLLKYPEQIEKALLRQKYDLSVYKDGTIRFDATNAPLTHVKLSQIETSLEKVKSLGYVCDVEGKQLESLDQTIELMAQDIVIPFEAGTYFVSVAKFIDELLVKVYEMDPYYNKIDTPADLIGKLVVGLAPHTSVGVVARVLGFTRAQVVYGTPFWHSAKRRDCDGDGDSLMLLLDVLLNFSKEFLPSQIGGLMDAPLLVQPFVLPGEVQRQGHNLEVGSRYPLEFYEATMSNEFPAAVANKMDVIRARLNSEKQFYGFGYTHPTTMLTSKRSRSSYSTLKTLSEKLNMQIEVAERISAVNPNEVVASVLKTHLLPDIIGNLKAYTSQKFRCKGCGERFRRIPLKGVCTECGGNLQPTVTRGSVEKYLSLALKLAKKYEVGDYIRSRLALAQEELNTLFVGKEGEEGGEIGAQAEISDYFFSVAPPAQ
jgi:DNA polymerase II large subunit